MWANRLGKTDITVEEVAREAKNAGRGVFGKCQRKSLDPWRHPISQARDVFRLRRRSRHRHRQARQEHSRHKINEYVWGVTFLDWSIRDGGGTDRMVSY
jgi:hypothetical protein